MTQPFLCPHCGKDTWTCGREHTIWEMFTISTVQPNGDFTEEGSDFGDSLSIGEWEEITCLHCGAEAPANHPLWPRKEESHE